MSKQASWWRGGVIYQIYPRSYQDSTGDGIGDLAGITQRLDHIADLGVDAIWISPFFTSPMKDFGYDVSDYCDVDPMFGTLADFDALLARAHTLGLKVMIDLVLSHTSDQHRWFAESRHDRSNPKQDWYVWVDPQPDGTPPNNWLSIFGGGAWQWDTRRRQYYMHNFLVSQPDLNLHNRSVQDALLDVARFWLDRGVDGFRLDTINFYFHDPELRDNPPLSPEQRLTSIAPDVNPYGYQDHVYDRNRPENIAFLQRLRALMDQYPDRAAVGEVGDAVRSLEIIAEYTAGDDRMHMCYGFDFLGPEPITPAKVTQVLTDFAAKAPDAWSCWSLSNHDVIRHRTRLAAASGDPEAFTRLLAALLLSLRGTICVYQGEELGLAEANVPYEQLQDPYGIEFWPEFKGRDGCRTPMPWQATAPSAGFSDGLPWLPVSADHTARAVVGPDGTPNPMIGWYKALIEARRNSPALRTGSINFHQAGEGVLLFTRAGEDGTASVLCAFNISDAAQTIAAPGASTAIIGSGGTAVGTQLSLGPYGLYWGSMAP